VTSFTLNELDEMAEAKKKEAFAESVVDSGDFDVSEDFDEEEEEDDEMSFDID